GATGSLGQCAQAVPQGRLKPPTGLDPLVRAVQHLAIDVMLTLVGRAVAPSHRSRAAITLEFPVLEFLRYRTAVDGVHDPRLSALIEGVQAPAEKGVRLVHEADPAQREHRVGCVADPRVTVVPVAHATYRRRQA